MKSKALDTTESRKPFVEPIEEKEEQKPEARESQRVVKADTRRQKEAEIIGEIIEAYVYNKHMR